MSEQVQDLGGLTLKLSKEGFSVEREGVTFRYDAPKPVKPVKSLTDHDTFAYKDEFRCDTFRAIEDIAERNINSSITIAGQPDVVIHTEYNPKGQTRNSELKVVRVGDRRTYRQSYEKDLLGLYTDHVSREAQEYEQQMKMASKVAAEVIDDLKLDQAFLRYTAFYIANQLKQEQQKELAKLSPTVRIMKKYLDQSRARNMKNVFYVGDSKC
ncbi:MAG: hypothetical protein ACMXYG_03280 [Candidatus Woesearchaeota archaeon]